MVEAQENQTTNLSRKEKKKLAKKKKRKEKRKEVAEKEREEEEAGEAEEERKLEAIIREAEEEREQALKEFDERERLWLQAMELKKKKELEEEEEEEEERRLALEEEEEEEAKGQLQVQKESECVEDDEWEYVEEGPAEIIWQGNEIIIKKKKVRVPKKESNQLTGKEDVDRPTSNPLPPQSEAFCDYKNAQQALESVAQQVPNFGTEQDKAHCPFHLKTGACRFGQSCSRVHFYPDKSCTLLIKNMYNGPGLAWEQDEGLEHTDEEVEHAYEEFYEDVHTEFLKFGEIINFKVCRNGSFHLRGNVYVQYKLLESAVLAYRSISGRYFASKQVKCEFVNVTRWKVAICGEYMKSRFKSCSHGTACNFIHCFRNPGGDYEWADWDKPPPKFWVKKMAALFGYVDEYGYEKQVDQDNVRPRKNSNRFAADSDRHWSRRSRSREMDCGKGGSDRSRDDEDDLWKSTHNQRSNNDNRKRIKLYDEKSDKESAKFKDHHHSESRSDEICSVGSWLDRDRDKDRDRHHGHRRKRTQHGSRSLEKSADYGNGKRTHEADSNGNGSGKDRDTPLHHARAKKSLRHIETRELKDDNGDHKNRGNEAQRNRDKDGERESSYLGKRSRDWSKVPHLDNHEESKKRNDAECSGDQSADRDGNRDRERHHRRKRSRYETKETEFSDDQRECADKLKENFHNGESDSERSNHRRGKTRKHSGQRSHSEREKTNPDCMHSKSTEDHEPNSPQSDERFVDVSNDCWEPSSLEEHPDFSRQVTGVQSSESSSPGRYNGRSNTQGLVLKYCYGDKNGDHQWDCNEDAYEEPHSSRSKSTCDDDKNQSSGKSNSENDRSSEPYNERRSRRSGQSSRERYLKCLKMETGSDKEYHEFKKNYRSHRVEHRSHVHRRHDK